MLELDIVFERFWKRAGDEMTDAEAGALEKLLLLPDNDLLDLVMGRAETGDPGVRVVVEKLRAA